MSEIRDSVRAALAYRISQYSNGRYRDSELEATVDNILAVPEIAIVEREAKPPTLGDEARTDDYVDGHIRARKDMVEQGWLKEVR